MGALVRAVLPRYGLPGAGRAAWSCRAAVRAVTAWAARSRGVLRSAAITVQAAGHAYVILFSLM